MPPEGPGRVFRNRVVLQKLMKAEGLSCNTLAPKIGRSRQLVAHWISGRRVSCSTESAQRLAAALGVTIDDLFLPSTSDGSPRVEE
jgi:plasmid maintenance system antidote protein VapI